jgi:hypothetical protein
LAQPLRELVTIRLDVRYRYPLTSLASPSNERPVGFASRLATGLPLSQCYEDATAQDSCVFSLQLDYVSWVPVWFILSAARLPLSMRALDFAPPPRDGFAFFRCGAPYHRTRQYASAGWPFLEYSSVTYEKYTICAIRCRRVAASSASRQTMARRGTPSSGVARWVGGHMSSLAPPRRV